MHQRYDVYVQIGELSLTVLTAVLNSLLKIKANIWATNFNLTLWLRMYLFIAIINIMCERNICCKYNSIMLMIKIGKIGYFRLY